ncbi:MAG TPA: dipeptidase [Chitinophagaceae bacterium]|nr:dipeptidase [Chitinophagaceae bacterium]
MKKALVPLLLFVSFISAAQSAKRIHRKAIVVDTHNDVLSSLTLKGIDISHRQTQGQSDLDRWKEGGLDVQFFSIWTGEKPRGKSFYLDANEEIDSLKRLILRNYNRMAEITSYRSIKRAVKKSKLACLIGVEGGHMMEDDLAKLNALYLRGMRYLTLTWNNSTSWASSAMDETEHPGSLKQKGLTEFGKQVVKKLNELGVMVDVSHVGEQTFYDAIATTTKPVLASHSSVWALCPVFRNLKDDQIKAVAKNKGVICINFYSGFISKAYAQRQEQIDGNERKRIQDSLFAITKDSAQMRRQWREYYHTEMEKLRPSIADVVDHIDYIVKLVGDSYVGIGSDFDGVSSLPVGLDDVTTYPKIADELVRRGYSKKSIKKILGGNVLRVMKANFN